MRRAPKGGDHRATLCLNLSNSLLVQERLGPYKAFALINEEAVRSDSLMGSDMVHRDGRLRVPLPQRALFSGGQGMAAGDELQEAVAPVGTTGLGTRRGVTTPSIPLGRVHRDLPCSHRGCRWDAPPIPPSHCTR